MRQLVNIISGFIFGLAPLAGVAITGIPIYALLPNITGVITLWVLTILSLWLGIRIFKRIQIIGPIDFMTAVYASPDLDDLEPVETWETKRRSPEEFVRLLENQNNLFTGGSFRIFGDWFGKPYKNYHEIESAHFERQLKKLTLTFKEGEKLEIYNPKHIFEASTFFKIIRADRIKLTWFHYHKTQKKENQYFLDYSLKDKKMITETNVDWYKPRFDISLGDQALMIFG
jgi:hypothetical protein